MRPLIEMADATIATPSGRLLFDGLNLRLGREHVALIGRNGVGKSTLLEVLAETDDDRVKTSPGERARAALICLFRRSPSPEMLLLDEPTYSLDLVGQSTMTEALRAWPGGLVVASHDRAFLAAIGVSSLIELGPDAA